MERPGLPDAAGSHSLVAHRLERREYRMLTERQGSHSQQLPLGPLHTHRYQAPHDPDISPIRRSLRYTRFQPRMQSCPAVTRTGFEERHNRGSVTLSQGGGGGGGQFRTY